MNKGPGYEIKDTNVGVIFLLLATLIIGLVVVLGLGFGSDVLLRKFSNSERPMSPLAKVRRVPPEPRLQGAPGFGVESPDGRVNMELGAPQSEYWELKKQWDKTWLHGSKDSKTGAVSALPIDMAKDRFLEQAAKARSGTEAEQAAMRSKFYFSDSSSGRRATERRR